MVDFSIWDLRNEFHLQEAAHLWFDIDPNGNEKAPEVEIKIKGVHGVLEEAMRKGEIKAAYPGVPYPDLISIVTREELRAYAECIGHKPFFLFHGEGEKQANLGSENKPGESRGFKYADDFRSVSKDGNRFSFTPKQAEVIKMLYIAKKSDTPDVTIASIRKRVSPEASTIRLKDIFRRNEKALKALIEKGDRKGTVRLRI
jgi:hypothetical protein